MKKLFTSIFACALAAGVALSLAGCDFGNSAGGENADGTDGTNTETSTGTGGNTNMGTDSNGDELVSDRLPEENFEEAWKAAFAHISDENIKIEFEYRGEMYSGGEPEITFLKIIVIRNGDLEHWLEYGRGDSIGSTQPIIPEENLLAESVIDFSGEKAVAYERGADKAWHKSRKNNKYKSLAELLEKKSYDSLVLQMCVWDEQNGGLSDGYTYSEKDKGYVHLINGNIGLVKVVYKFRDGKVISVRSERQVGASTPEGGTTHGMEICSWNVSYGGQTVTLPTVIEK